MANLPESATWEPGVYQIETVDPIVGGPSGISNQQGKHLTNRTVFLKQEVDKQQIILTSKTITVGSGQDFNTLQEAWDSLIGAIILAQVTIQIDDGTYNQSIITLSNQPYAQLIRIQGNLGTPANVVFNFTPTGGVSDGIICEGVVGLQLAGFKLQGVISETKRLLRIDKGSAVICDSASIIMQGGDAGLSCPGGSVDFQSMTVSGCIVSIFCEFNSTIDARNCNITGVSQAAGNFAIRALNNGYIMADDVVISTANAGASAGNAGTISCRGASISNCDKSVHATAGQIICAGATSTDHTSFGFRADKGGIINGLLDGSYGAIIAVSAVIASQTGFSADQGGVVLAIGATAVNQFIAYRALSLGLIDAFNTVANNSGNTTDYDPAVSGFDSSNGGRTVNFS